MNDMTPEEARVWTRTWDRLDGDDHGYRAHVADEAVLRYRAKRRKTPAKEEV